MHNAYLCLDQSTSRIYVSRHVVFVENSFPFSTAANPSSTTPLLTAGHWVESFTSSTIPNQGNDTLPSPENHPCQDTSQAEEQPHNV